MTVTLTEKIIAGLAKSSSQNPAEADAIYALGSKLAVNAALKQLLEKRTIGTCRITRGGRTFDVYWLAFQTPKPKHYSALFTPEKRLAIAAAKPAKKQPQKIARTERPCVLCRVTKPDNAYRSSVSKCEACMKKLRAADYQAKKAQKDIDRGRWCMSCKDRHPVTAFGNTRSRRCTASMRLYQKNERAILTQKNREYRARVKARLAENQSAGAAVRLNAG